MSDRPKCIKDRCWSPVACTGFGYCRELNMADRDCRSCAYHLTISARDCCARSHMTDADGNPTYASCSFQRDPIGVHGTIQCGPDATEWRERG